MNSIPEELVVSLPTHIIPRLMLYFFRKHVHPFTGLCSNVLREICEYLQELPMLTCITASTVCRYRTDLEQWEPLYELSGTLRMDAQQATFLWLGNSLLFVYGTVGTTNNTYIVDKKQVVKLPSMKEFRRSPGLFYDFRFRKVYVFGGGLFQQGKLYAVDNIRDSCEGFSVLQTAWSDIGTMIEPRHSFTPCEYEGKVILIGGCFTSSVEVYDPQCQSFTPLPQIVAPDSHACASVVCYPATLLIVTTHYISRWDLRTKTEMKRQKREYSELVDCCMPVIRKSGFYYVHGDLCVKIDLDSCQTQYSKSIA